MIATLSVNTHQGYGFVYDKIVSDWLVPQNPAPAQPKQPKPGCEQDKTGGDRGDIEDLLGRAGLSGGISILGSAPGNPEGIIFRISNQQSFLATLGADRRFRRETPFGGEHISQVGGGNIFDIGDYRSFTTRRDSLGPDSTGFRRSLQVVVGPPIPGGGALGYADLDCDNPAQDLYSLGRHGAPIVLRRLGRLFRR